MNKPDLKALCDWITNASGRNEARVVDYKTYKVLESMVKDGLISGHPYSEFATDATIAEFAKRMAEFKEIKLGDKK